MTHTQGIGDEENDETGPLHHPPEIELTPPQSCTTVSATDSFRKHKFNQERNGISGPWTTFLTDRIHGRPDREDRVGRTDGFADGLFMTQKIKYHNSLQNTKTLTLTLIRECQHLGSG